MTSTKITIRLISNHYKAQLKFTDLLVTKSPLQRLQCSRVHNRFVTNGLKIVLLLNPLVVLDLVKRGSLGLASCPHDFYRHCL